MANVNPMTVMERLGIGKEQFRAIGLVPLAYVAWADGALQIFERSAVMEFAKQKGWLDSGEDELLSVWLTTAPRTEDAIDAARAVASLARDHRALGASVHVQTPVDILLACHDVAEASGALFGLRSAISKEESTALQEITDALEIEPGATWRVLVARLSDTTKPSVPESESVSVGEMPDMLREPLNFFMRRWQRCGDLSRIEIGPFLAHLAVHPDHAQHVLVDNSRNYVRDPLFEELSRVIGWGVLTLDGGPWLRQRRMLQPAFHQKKVAGMAAGMVEESQIIVESMLAAAQAGRAVDLADEMGRLGLRIASRTLFNTETAEEADALTPAIQTMFAHIGSRTRSPLKIPEAIPTAANRRFREAMGLLNAKVYQAIERRRASHEQFDDLLSLLLEARDEETGRGMTDEQLRNEVLALLLGSSDTAATALIWTWALVSKVPHIMRQLQAEVEQVLGGRQPTLEDLPKLVYTWAILQESMRLMPPPWLLTRKAVAEDRLSGRPIPAGSLVYISPYLIHRHPKFWDNPEAFDPARFTPENDARRHPCAYLPFGAGPRKCLGTAYAVMEMKIALSMMVQAVDLHFVPGFEVKVDTPMFLRPKNGCWMTVHPRN